MAKNIEIILSFKSNINRLFNAFSALSALVNHVVEEQVPPLLSIIDTVTKNPTPQNLSFMRFQQQVRKVVAFSLSYRGRIARNSDGATE